MGGALMPLTVGNNNGSESFRAFTGEFTIMREILAWLLYTAHALEKSQKQDY
jgi:hypothetical protein